MTKCNRCGNETPEGPICQSCGAPLSSKADAGFVQRTNIQEQSNLPAWLETLRAGERPTPAAGGEANFSAADLIDEGPLPSWMRPERGELPDVSNAPMPGFAGQRSASDGGTFPPNGLAAQSLIDEKSLPSWMKDGEQPPPVPGSLSASSLLQKDSLPDWMTTLQQQSNAIPPSFQEKTGSPGQQGRAGAPSSSELAPGFSARDLIDQQSLPTWMKPQGEQGALGPQTEPFGQGGRGAASSQPPQSGFSASSLLDADSLPPWMREGGYDPGVNAAPPQPTWPAQTPPHSSWPSAATSSNTNWPASQRPAQPSMPAMDANQAPGQNSSLSASSFIDASALPEWLRNAGEQPSQMAQPGQSGALGPARQGSYPVPPRVENVRVPSRPRNSDIGSSESSEVAANVFASMLGVASATPGYPNQSAPQPQAPYQQPGPGSQPFGQAGQAGQAATPPVSPASLRPLSNTPPSMGGTPPYGSTGMPGSALGIPTTPGTANAPGSMSMPGYGNNFPPNNPAVGQMGNPPSPGSPGSPGSPYYPGNAASPSLSGVQGSGPAGDQKTTKKRGLFGAFLDWLSR